ncbi:DUF2489 domain-containing protein [Shewanella eurypsychrophilus]|uniref:DUF2489 domain-containing protein n=1 Tax=Shewanella eurypsychrophilus TaxID=2593656 RepID=A0ABX6V2N1_9GAMM|nr:MULTISPECIES: DUF2489 domain-containing protein [Shewanella]QFU20499.1 DUF2489 domain-containing protein [Shewanella sp. YLB-09]QFU20780.1 DUF2489 domain-containing protein [Shewanella sp. YLB-09]QPG56075.1 DUF2489 domain-containing protein [Shewanella eurypsychrophilus]
MTTVLLLSGFIIISLLASYATFLLLKLRKQASQKAKHQQELQDINQARLDEHLSSIRYIATAMLEDRCEISEGVMRIAKLFSILSMSEQVEPEYPAIFKHFNVIQDHPIMEQRKSLEKKQRMRFDFARMRSEAELEAKILEEAKKLTSFAPNPLH